MHKVSLELPFALDVDDASAGAHVAQVHEDLERLLRHLRGTNRRVKATYLDWNCENCRISGWRCNLCTVNITDDYYSVEQNIKLLHNCISPAIKRQRSELKADGSIDCVACSRLKTD